MDPAQLVQATFAGLGLTVSAPVPAPNCTNNTAQDETTQWHPSTTPADSISTLNLSTLISFFLSFSALHDWLKLFVIGGIIESCRRAGLRLWSMLIESFWITACFEQGDESYNWILFWLSKHPKWKQARMVDISTRSFGLNSPAISMLSENAGNTAHESRKLCYLPSFSRTYSLWHKGHYLSVTRTQSGDRSIGGTREYLRIDILSINHDFLNNLLLEAKATYRSAQENLVSIYVSESHGGWRHVTSRPKRPLHSIVLDPGVKDLLLKDAADFLESKDWYSQRGIPFRRGYLLYGAPGSGKTSMIHSLAGELGLDVYIISLARSGLDDTTLNELIFNLPERCIALMEDIDAAFTQSLTRDVDEDGAMMDDPAAEPDIQTNGHKEREKDRKRDASAPLSRVTLSGLLNALDGVGAQEGRILYATTNCYSALDPALCRPGRMDLHVEFKLASKYQARELFKCFYLPSFRTDDSETRCRSSWSQNASSSCSLSRLLSLSPIKFEGTTSALESVKTDSVYVGIRHDAEPLELSEKELLELADKFADIIPEREISMATLQGYLMSYKTRPTTAVDDASAWVESERPRKAKKGGGE